MWRLMFTNQLTTNHSHCLPMLSELRVYTLVNNHHLPTYVNHLLVLPNCLIWMPTNQHIKTCIMIVVLKLILYSKIIWVANRINYGGRSFKTFLLMSSYLRKFLLLLMLLSNNFDFVFNNDKQGHFVKMHPTMSSEYFLFFSSINKFVKVTTRDTVFPLISSRGAY